MHDRELNALPSEYAFRLALRSAIESESECMLILNSLKFVDECRVVEIIKLYRSVEHANAFEPARANSQRRGVLVVL